MTMAMSELYVCKFCGRGQCDRCGTTDCHCCYGGEDVLYALQVSAERAMDSREHDSRFDFND